MNREQLEELAALDALGLLEPEQRQALSEHLRENPADKAVMAGYAEAIHDLALVAEQLEPPEHLKARVMAALPERTRAADTSTAAQPHALTEETSNVVTLRWVPWAVAACLALVSGLLVQSNLRLRGEVAALEERGAVDRLAIAVLSSQLQDSPEARAVCVWDDERQEGLLTVENLPPPPADKDYQLWVVDPSYGTPVDGGVFNTSEDGSFRYRFHPNQPIRSANVFAVSLERQGGVPKAEGPMVLMSQDQ
ncbi:MAG: anti-sigma factor [Opitutaceae bacterium]